MIRLSDNQLKRVKVLVHKRCCNYDDGGCLLLDWPFCNVCPQCHSNSLCCKWFRNAVLPNDPLLEAEILGNTNIIKHCHSCGRQFVPKSNRAKYCNECAIKKKRKDKAKWAAKKRLHVEH